MLLFYAIAKSAAVILKTSSSGVGQGQVNLSQVLGIVKRF